MNAEEINAIVADVYSDSLVLHRMEQEGFIDLSPRMTFLYSFLGSANTFGVLKNASDFSGKYVDHFRVRGSQLHEMIEDRTRSMAVRFFYQRTWDSVKYNGDVPYPFFELSERHILDYMGENCIRLENHIKVGKHFKNCLDIVADQIKWGSVVG